MEGGGVTEGGEKTAASAFSWREDRGHQWSVYLCLANALCMCLNNTPTKTPFLESVSLNNEMKFVKCFILT